MANLNIKLVKSLNGRIAKHKATAAALAVSLGVGAGGGGEFMQIHFLAPPSQFSSVT